MRGWMCLMFAREKLFRQDNGYFSFLVLIFGRLIAYALCLSARFLSATVLPGNSEVIFVALAVPKLMLGSLFNADILALILIATAGNGLGSLTTYGIGRWIPKFDPKITALYGQ